MRRLAEDIVAQLDGIRQVLAEGAERGQPLGDAAGAFLSGLVKQIPFGIGERAGQVFDALGKLLANLPDFLAATLDGLIQPLAGWFPEEDGGVQEGLFTPIRQVLLVPLSHYLDDGVTLFDAWEDRLNRPAQDALAERQRVLKEIADYKQQNNLS